MSVESLNFTRLMAAVVRAYGDNDCVFIGGRFLQTVEPDKLERIDHEDGSVEFRYHHFGPLPDVGIPEQRQPPAAVVPDTR